METAVCGYVKGGTRCYDKGKQHIPINLRSFIVQEQMQHAEEKGFFLKSIEYIKVLLKK